MLGLALSFGSDFAPPASVVENPARVAIGYKPLFFQEKYCCGGIFFLH